MKVLVTGATGFLGRATCQRLLAMGYEVTGLGRNAIIGKALEAEGIAFVQADLGERESIVQAAHGHAYIVHAGALSTPWGAHADFYHSNVLGTEHIIEGAIRGGARRLIHISTPSIYFQHDERLQVKENDPLPDKFANSYATTKYMAEQRMDAAFASGLPVITLRPRALFGPNDQAIIPRLIEANRRRFIPIMNEQVRLSLTYVDNVVDAICLCLHSDESTLGQKYNITNGEEPLLLDVLEQLFMELGEPLNLKRMNEALLFRLAGCLEWGTRLLRLKKEPMLTQYTVSVLAKTQTLCIEKARAELGYSPRISIAEGIERFAKWWREQHEHSS